MVLAEEEAGNLALTMASEWNDWPCVFAMAVGQMFLINNYAHNVILFFIVIEIIWFFIAEKFVNFNLAYQFHGLCRLCWLSSFIMALILLFQGRIITSVVALAWVPLLMAVSFIVFLFLSFILNPLGINPPKIEVIELKMKAAILNLGQDETKAYIATAKDLFKQGDA